MIVAVVVNSVKAKNNDPKEGKNKVKQINGLQNVDWQDYMRCLSLIPRTECTMLSYICMTNDTLSDLAQDLSTRKSPDDKDCHPGQPSTQLLAPSCMDLL